MIMYACVWLTPRDKWAFDVYNAWNKKNSVWVHRGWLWHQPRCGGKMPGSATWQIKPGVAVQSSGRAMQCRDVVRKLGSPDWHLFFHLFMGGAAKRYTHWEREREKRKRSLMFLLLLPYRQSFISSNVFTFDSSRRSNHWELRHLSFFLREEEPSRPLWGGGG